MIGLSAMQLSSMPQDSGGVGTIERLDPAFDQLLPKEAKIEKVAGGFTFVEGPLWRSDGTLWFSDVVGNMIRSVTPAGQVKVMIPNSGGGTVARPGLYAGSNGMTADKDGAALVCQHFNRAIARIDKDLKVTPVIEKFEGQRLNSPNDLVYRKDGVLFFTDPPFGLARGDTDPAKELKFNAVYSYMNGKLTPIVKDLDRPNGIGFSPDQKTMYVSNAGQKRYWMKYDVAKDGTVSNAKMLFDVSNEKNTGLPDGLKVDSKGNVWGAGPGGVWVFSPDGKHLGTIKTPEGPANCGWGDDGKTLYITAVTSVYRIKTAVAGEMPLYK